LVNNGMMEEKGHGGLPLEDGKFSVKDELQ
jgi:hypothetical protein